MTETKEKGNIMVVDDTPANLKILQEVLQIKGYRVLALSDGKTALKVAARNPPDLILLDIIMPDMDGFEVCKSLKADAALRDIPVIFISALTETEDIVKAFAVGGVDYVTKPFQFEEVNTRVETHLRLRKQQLELITLNEQKNHFLGMAAHDLRNPLSGIMCYSELLADELAPLLNASQVKLFGQIVKSSEFMSGLINDLLDISAIESGHLSIERRPVDITLPITSCVEINRALAAKKNMAVTLSCPVKLPEVFADVYRIEQVMNNLLSNAMKYAQPGTEITVRLSVEKGEVIISVADQGPGIPAKEQDKLFQAFAKTSVKTTAGERSTGLGLLIVKKIVDAHEGRIGFISEPGKGTEFFFALPAISSEAKDEGMPRGLNKDVAKKF